MTELIRPSRRKIIAFAAAAPAILSAGWGLRGDLGCDVILLCGDSNTFSGINIDGSIPTPVAGKPQGLESRNPYASNPVGAFSNQGSTSNWFKNYICPAQDQFAYNNSWPNLSANTNVNLGGYGPGLTFMKAYLAGQYGANGNRNILVVGVAVGGTGLVSVGTSPWSGSYWNASNGSAGGAALSVARANAAIGLDSRNAIKAILWTSGANDAIQQAGTGIAQSDYTSAFQALVTYWRTNITGATNVPVLVEGLVPNWPSPPSPGYSIVNNALLAMPSNVSKCGVCNMSLTGLIGQTNPVYHYTAGAQIILGNSFYNDAFLNLSP